MNSNRRGHGEVAALSNKTNYLRIAVVALMMFVTIDLVKGVFPYTCSLPGHYHLVSYGDTHSSDTGVRYQSGRPLLSYSGGKRDCKSDYKGGFISAIPVLWHLALKLPLVVLALPSAAVEMLGGNAFLGAAVRILNALALLLYCAVVMGNFYLSGSMVLDLSEDEVGLVKNKCLELKNAYQKSRL